MSLVNLSLKIAPRDGEIFLSLHEALPNAIYLAVDTGMWDVKWSPMGIYFATASRDRTARLWSTDRTACLRLYAGHLSDVDVSHASTSGAPAPNC